MSDPVTNVEIEDVLSSIRRLVSDGDKARTRDPAPIEVAAQTPFAVTEQPAEDPESTKLESAIRNAKPDRLILTPAFLVVASDRRESPEQDPPEQDALAGSEDDADDHVRASQDVEDDAANAPLRLTNMVWEEVEDLAADHAETSKDTQISDRSDLVATIAELEAAISKSSDDYEPDGSETMAETLAWPGAVARGSNIVEDAEIREDMPAAAQIEDVDDEDTVVKDGAAENFGAFEHRGVQDRPAADTSDDYGDDDLDGLLEAGGTTLDEAALRALVADVVREELTGPLGERITRNVRKLVRREIYRTLSSQEFD